MDAAPALKYRCYGRRSHRGPSQTPSASEEPSRRPLAVCGRRKPTRGTSELNKCRPRHIAVPCRHRIRSRHPFRNASPTALPPSRSSRHSLAVPDRKRSRATRPPGSRFGLPERSRSAPPRAAKRGSPLALEVACRVQTGVAMQHRGSAPASWLRLRSNEP